MTKNLLLALLLGCTSCSFAQTGFYDRSSIQTIEIFFAASNWDAQLDAATSTDSYIIADSVRINGVVYDSVGVKYKGNSSYNANNNKNPMHLNLDYIKGKQDYQGYTSVKLSNCYNDPSMIREVLAYSIAEQFMDSPKSNFANVYINGTLRGLYSNSQNIDDRFHGDHYYSSNDISFKCNPIGGAGPGTSVNPDLNYINSDSTSYYSRYELDSDYGWTKMVALIDTLNNNFSKIETMLDVDRALWMLAFNNVIVNLDSYNGATRQNYYLYYDVNDRFVPISWDLNESFDAFPGGTGTGSYVASSLDPLSNSTSANHPLIVKMMSNPMYKRMYMAHVRTMVKEFFETGDYLDTANALRTLITSSVTADPYKFYTTTQFQNSLSTGVTGGGPGGHQIPGLQALMDARVTFFNSNSNYALVAPVLSSVSADDITPNYGQLVTITATCSGENAVYIGYRYKHALKFNRVAMYDDGMHGDGSAGDHVYGIQLPMNDVAFEYYVYAENADAGVFSPTRAEHEFHTLTISVPLAQNGDIKINELMASNSITAYDSNGENDDWIELYNTTDHGVDVSNLFLSDDVLNFSLWQFPAGTAINAHDYLIVWADNDIEQSGLHAGFKLTSLGEPLILSNGTTVFDEIDFAAQTTDVSYFRCQDGGASLVFGTPSFQKTNACSASLSDNLMPIEVVVFPNPTNGKFSVLSSSSIEQVRVTDLFGRLMYVANKLQSETVELDVTSFSSGVYLISVQDHAGKVKTIQLVKKD